MLGSRYCPGGRVENWGRARRLISTAGCLYARTLLGVGVRDLTGGFKCFRRAVLEAIDLDAVDAQGYQFQIEMTYRALLLGFSVVEVPITFADRVAGGSKMSRSIVFEAMRRVPLLRLEAARGRLPRRAGVALGRRLLDSSDAAPEPLIGAAAGGRRCSSCAASAAWTYVERPQLGGTPQQWYRTSAPQVLVPVEHAGNLADLRARDRRRGRRAAKLRSTGDGLVLELDSVADGTHHVRVEASPARVFGDTRRRGVHDPRRHAPPRAGARPGADRLAVRERAERARRGRLDARAHATAGRAAGRASRSGAFALDPKLPDGRTTVRLVASDRAGNRSVITRTVAVDRTHAARAHRPRARRCIGTAHPTLRGSLDDASPVSVQALLDGTSVALRAPDGRRCSAHGALSGRFSLPLQHLAQGVHTLSITATDAAGNTTTAKAGPFTVDSTEKLRASTVLSLGARGADVVQLERRLKAFGLYRGPFTRFYNARTAAAVRAFQRAHDLPVTGIATPAGARSSAPSASSCTSTSFRVFLIRDGKRVFSAPIAIGQPAYPTPTGHYEIIAKIKNPTWVPPNSPWAAGLEPIPPGASNPLGSRWIGTSAPNIGFHATPAATQRRARGLARLHAHAPRRRRAPLRSDPRRHAGRHRGISAPLIGESTRPRRRFYLSNPFFPGDFT